MSKKENKYKDYNKHKSTYAPTGLGEYFGLGRPIDFYDYPTRLCLMFTVLTAVAEMFYQSKILQAEAGAMTMAIGVGFSFFFSFFITAELDPDRHAGGLIAGFLSALGVHFMGVGNAAVLIWLLWLLRMLNRTAGDRHRMVDDILLIGCAAYLGKTEFWTYPLLTAVAFIIDSQLPEGYFGSYFLAAMAFAVTFFADMSRDPASLTVTYIYLGAVAFILFLPALRVASLCQAVGDKDGAPLYKLRVWAAQGSFLFIIMTLIVMCGDKQAVNLLPAIMAAIGAGAFLPYDLAINKPYNNKN